MCEGVCVCCPATAPHAHYMSCLRAYRCKACGGDGRAKWSAHLEKRSGVLCAVLAFDGETLLTWESEQNFPGYSGEPADLTNLRLTRLAALLAHLNATLPNGL